MEEEDLLMTLRAGAAWLALLAAVVLAAFAPIRGDRSGGNDVVPGAANGPVGANANPGKKKRALDQDLVSALYRVGLQAENLAACGTSANDADTRLSKAVNSRDALIRTVQSGLGTKDDLAALNAAVAEFGAATTNEATVLGSLFSAGTAGLASGVASTLSETQVNEAAWSLPLPYCVKDRDQSDWVTLRDALDNERVSAKEGASPDPDMQAYLSNVRADTVIASAQTNVNTNLGAVQAAWEAAAVQGD